MPLTIKEIDSIKNEKIQLARDLSLPQCRRETRQVVLYGEDSIRWAKTYRCRLEYILCTQPMPQNLELSDESVECFLISEGISKKVSGTSQVIPYIAVASMNDTSIVRSESIVVLDDVKDHGNIGTIIRTAAAFGFKNIVLTNTNNDIYYKNIVNASRGTALNVSYANISADRLTDYLRKSGYQILSSSPYGNCDLRSAAQTFAGKKIAVILGNETNGVSDPFIESSDAVIRIDIDSSVESLNVGVASGIILSSLRQS